MLIPVCVTVYVSLTGAGIWGSEVKARPRRDVSSSPSSSSTVMILPPNVLCHSITGPGGTRTILQPKVILRPPGSMPAMYNVDRHLECRLPDCYTNPCKNQGSCEETVDGYICICLPCFKGRNCETAITAKIFIKSSDGVPDVSALEETLTFSSVPFIPLASRIEYDSIDKKIYWVDSESNVVCRADDDGGNGETVKDKEADDIIALAVAERSRILFFGTRGKHIRKISIAQGNTLPRTGTDFLPRLRAIPITLAADERHNFIYWSMRNGFIQRSPFSGADVATFYKNPIFTSVTGLSFDPSRSLPRVIFSDFRTGRSFYKDITTPLNTETAQELTHYMIGPDRGNDKYIRWHDLAFFNGTLYWTGDLNNVWIAIMTNYDQNNRSFRVIDTNQTVKVWAVTPGTTLDPGIYVYPAL